MLISPVMPRNMCVVYWFMRVFVWRFIYLFTLKICTARCCVCYLWILYCTVLCVLTKFEEIRQHTHNQAWQLTPLIHEYDVYCPVLCVFVFYDHGEATMSRLPSCLDSPLFWKRALWLRALLHDMYCPVLRVFVYHEHEVATMYRLPSVLQKSPMT